MNSTTNLGSTRGTPKASPKADDSIARARSDGQRSRKSWRAPFFMLALVLAGIVFSLFHHFLNASLNGQSVDQAVISQVWAVRLGTGFAFLVKMCFVASVGTAFVQRQWLLFHRRAFKIEDIDVVTSISTNFFDFFGSSVWVRNMTLTLIAITSWALPLAAVVTPGSLLVMPRQISNITYLQVPQLWPDNPNQSSTYESTVTFNGDVRPKDPIFRVAYAAGTSGRPVTLPLTMGYQNQSYDLEFFGSAIKCKPADPELIYNMTVYFGNNESFYDGLVFAAWVPADLNAVYKLSQLVSSDNDSPGPLSTDDMLSTAGTRIFVFSNLGRSSNNITFQAYERTNEGEIPVNVTYPAVNVTECVLHNASYKVNFDLHASQQTLTTAPLIYHNPVGRPGQGCIDVHSEQCSMSTFYNSTYGAVMGGFSKLLVGSDQVVFPGGFTPVSTIYNLLQIDWTSYETMQSGLEQLFQNCTLSLMADGTLIKTPSTAEKVPVTITSYPNTYVYNRKDLLIPYGISLLVATVCTVVGMHAYIVNDGSYQNVFSTFLRATNDDYLRLLLDRDVDRGEDPLPKNIGKVKTTMTGKESDGSAPATLSATINSSQDK